MPTFPTTSVLDTFTGSDEDPIATNWSGPLFSGTGQLRLVSNALRGDVDGQTSGSYYDVATFGPDVEAYITIVTKDADVDSFTQVMARISGMGGGDFDGYFVSAITRSGTDEFEIRRLDNGSSTLLGSAISQEFASGDSFGIQCIGDQISAWYKPSAGSWTLLGTRTDATYSGAGTNIGVNVFRNGVVGTILDDFGGGDYQIIPASLDNIDFSRFPIPKLARAAAR